MSKDGSPAWRVRPPGGFPAQRLRRASGSVVPVGRFVKFDVIPVVNIRADYPFALL